MNRKQILHALCLGCWMVSGAIAGCTQAPTPSDATAPSSTVASPTPSPTPTPPALQGVQSWSHLAKGESVHGLTFSTDGKLLYRDQVLLAEVPVSYVSDGQVIYAEHLLVSDPSPSGRFTIVKACETADDEPGLCWSVFLVDQQAGNATNVSIAKYGGLDWVEWTADERYAVFAESMEGVSWFVALDLETKEAKMFDQTEASADLSSFVWTGDRTFTANLICHPDCAASPFRGDITRLFSQ